MLIRAFAIAVCAILLSGCGTMINSSHTDIRFEFSDNSTGTCYLKNRRGSIKAEIPSIVSVPRSDDALSYDCETTDGEKTTGKIPWDRSMAGLGSAFCFDLCLGLILDEVTDQNKRYPKFFAVPVVSGTTVVKGVN